MKNFSLMVVVAVLLGSTNLGFGAVASDDFTILSATRYSPTSGSTTAPYGGCLLKVTPSPDTVLAGCRKTYITFDCNGDYDSKSVAQTKFDMAQLAIVTGRTARIVLDDSRLHSSYCFAQSVGVNR